MKRLYRTASIVTAERVVFNIKGNDYRLFTAIDYQKGILWIKWVGAHQDYDRIDVGKVHMTNDLKPNSFRKRLPGRARRGRATWGAKSGTPEGDRLEIVATLVDAYENEHEPMDPPDPIEAIEFRMEQQGLTRRDLEGMLGSRARVAEVLNRKRDLSISMIRRLHETSGFPPKCSSDRYGRAPLATAASPRDRFAGKPVTVVARRFRDHTYSVAPNRASNA